MSELARILAICAMCLLAIIPVGYVFIRILEMTETPSESMSNKPTYTGGIEKVNEHTANVTVNGRTFTVAQNKSGIHVQETTGGRISSWVTMSDSSARFGKTKSQAAAEYIKTIVDERHPIP